MAEVMISSPCVRIPRLSMHRSAVYDYANRFRLQMVHESIGNLDGESLLPLQSLGEAINQARQL